MSQPFFANVKSALSGDTLVLANTNNPSLERVISLAYVTGPRLSKDGDEPFAFQSREHLRRLVVGKRAKCSVMYSIPSGREFGHVQLQDGTSFPENLVRAGWLKVREDAGSKEESDDAVQRIENLRSLESQAKSESAGLWAGVGGIIEVQNDLGGPNFVNEWKGKTVDAVVERVLSGDRLLMRLLTSEKKHLQVMVLVAGIRSPSTARTIPSTGQSQPAEEYGNEARAFVESRLLQRDVKVEVVGLSPQGQLIAAVLHPRGSIAEFLLAEGLARCNDFHSTLLGGKMAALRAAEKKAQAAKLNLHKHHVAKAGEGSTSDMIVSKIMGADTIFVRAKAGAEKRISLSSVRGPRAGEPSEAPFRDEAKEFLRKRLIGKHVKVSVDGSKPASDGFEARDVATVTEKGKNINLQLVQEGWCSVIRHRRDDTDRAPNYDELLTAQETAKEEKKGIWSDKAPKRKGFMDASESVQKAKIQLSTLARQKKVPGVVDFCKAGSRFTILVPREGVKLTMVLAGVRAPRAPRLPQDKGEPFGQEALDLANRRCNQRDCEIDVHDIDKVGGFIGDLYVNRESIAKLLVEEGLASVHRYSAEKAGNANELLAAEKSAKEGRKGLWKDWDPSQDEDDQEEAAVETTTNTGGQKDMKGDTYRDVTVTSIDDNGRLKIQRLDENAGAFGTLVNEFRKFHLDPLNNKSLGDAPKAGQLVAAKFSLDGQWYRAKVRSNDRAAKVAEVVYIDYGNSEKVPWSGLRSLESQFSLQRLKAQATDAVLSFIQLPTAPEYFQEARDCLLEETDGRSLAASFDHVDEKEGLSYITLFYPADGQKNASFADSPSVNKKMLEEGLALVPKKLKDWERGPKSAEVLKKYRVVESEAKSQRAGMWEYGDITED